MYWCTIGAPLYADDLALIMDTQQKCITKLKAWKAGMESKRLWVNMKKTKFLDSGDGQDVLQKSGKYPCAVCCSGVGRNSILCSQCDVGPEDVQSHNKSTKTISALGVRASHGP